MRQKLFSVTMADCDFQTFTVHGPGGGGKDTSNTGVRIVHRASGAVGECRVERSQLSNKRRAFGNMARTATFKQWARRRATELQGMPTVDEIVEMDMRPENIKVEFMDKNGRWVNESQGQSLQKLQ